MPISRTTLGKKSIVTVSNPETAEELAGFSGVGVSHDLPIHIAMGSCRQSRNMHPEGAAGTRKAVKGINVTPAKLKSVLAALEAGAEDLGGIDPMFHALLVTNGRMFVAAVCKDALEFFQ